MQTFTQAKKMFWFKLWLSFSIVATWWFVAFFNLYLEISLYSFSMQPKVWTALPSIFSYPFIHGNIEHLINNSLSGFLIFFALFSTYEKISLNVLSITYIFSGILLWFIGEKNSAHIGASSVIYGIAFFLFVAGILSRKSEGLAITFLISAWYGSMIWGIFPFSVKEGVSWEGHLSGAIVGVILACWFYLKHFIFSFQKTTTDNNDFHFFERYPLPK